MEFIIKDTRVFLSIDWDAFEEFREEHTCAVCENDLYYCRCRDVAPFTLTDEYDNELGSGIETLEEAHLGALMLDLDHVYIQNGWNNTVHIVDAFSEPDELNLEFIEIDF